MSFYVVERPWLPELVNRIRYSHDARAAVANGLVVICLSCLLTVSNAFQTQNLGLLHQLSLWLVVCLLLVVQLSFIQRVIRKRLSESIVANASANIAAVTATVVLMTIELHWLKFTPLLPKQPDPLPEFLLFVAPPVISIAVIVLALRFLLNPVEKLATDYSELETEAANCKNLDREQELAEIIGNNVVLHVMAHDHYLEIKCEQQVFFVRARMKDALIHLDEIPGVQVHRSHWVAHVFLMRMFREGRDYRILLGDGTNIPVARSRANQLRRAQF